ncbi:helix-turn-helix domain-containing protein [Clostridium sp.]|uniref:helix-turn-helix domain-containing protein n=1 Tax=Clostridium sp. TaxID=1506 RepID=UPI0032168C4B
MNIGENIKKIRTTNKMTQLTLAGSLKISVRTLQKYESGEITPPVDKLDKIANALDVSIAELISSPESYSEDIRPFVPTSSYNGKKYTDNLFDELLSIEKQIQLYESNANFNTLVNGFGNYIELLKKRIDKTEEYYKQKELELLIENDELRKELKNLNKVQ